jgi:hypothetical protein
MGVGPARCGLTLNKDRRALEDFSFKDSDPNSATQPSSDKVLMLDGGFSPPLGPQGDRRLVDDKLPQRTSKLLIIEGGLRPIKTTPALLDP